MIKLAEREGFEPPLPFRVNTLSKRAPSATRPSLRQDLEERYYVPEGYRRSPSPHKSPTRLRFILLAAVRKCKSVRPLRESVCEAMKLYIRKRRTISRALQEVLHWTQLKWKQPERWMATRLTKRLQLRRCVRYPVQG